MKPIHTAALGVALLCAAAAPASATVTLGAEDTFEDGTTDGWISGAANPNPPFVTSDGGPGGLGDAFLNLVANGSAGPGGKLVGIAGAQWSGDYLAAGVSAIAMDVNNLGATDVSLRLYVSGPGGAAFSLDPIVVSSGSGWTHILLPTTPAALVGATGQSAPGALANVTELRLFHSPVAGYPGPNIAAQIGIDNVAAVPEPDTWAMLGLGLAMLGAMAVRSRRSVR